MDNSSKKNLEPDPFSLPHSLPNPILQCSFPHALHNHASEYHSWRIFLQIGTDDIDFITIQPLKRQRYMFWHDLLSAWNPAEDMIVVGPLTSNAYTTCPETFSTFSTFRNVLSEQKGQDGGRLVGTSKSSGGGR